MTGIYIHIPFCIQKCNYCDFLSLSGMEKYYESYVEALENEMAYYQGLNRIKNISTIFFGGGTPTILPVELLAGVLSALKTRFGNKGRGEGHAESKIETTLEANPKTVNLEGLHKLREAGFNRISLGLQASGEKELRLLGRVHSLQDFEQSYQNARQAGFENINIDLIFGIPGQSMRDWEESLSYACSLSPNHISAYCLSIEKNTVFDRLLKEGQIQLDEDLSLEMYSYCVDTLLSQGYQHIEISNFAKSGCECRHNLGYWERRDYLGLGIGAHSFLEGARFNNTLDIKEYLAYWNNKKSTPETRYASNPCIQNLYSLNEPEAFEESIFLGLRLIKGIDLKAFEKTHGSIFTRCGDKLPFLIDQGFLEIHNERLCLTRKGISVSNKVIGEML